MTRLVKQSTNAHIVVGPFVDITDAVTPKTSLTLGDITCRRLIEVSGGTAVANASITLAGSGNNGFTHLNSGYWELDLTATDTGTLGAVTITFRDDDVFLPVNTTLQVVPDHVYDGLVAGTDQLQVDQTHVDGTALTTHAAGYVPSDLRAIAGDATDASDLGAAIDNTNNLLWSNPKAVDDDVAAAGNLKLMFNGTGYAGGGTRLEVDLIKIANTLTVADRLVDMLGLTGTTPGSPDRFAVDTGGFAATTTQFEVSTADSTDDIYNGRYVAWVGSSNLIGGVYQISDYDGANNRFTVATMAGTPSNADTFILL